MDKRDQAKCTKNSIIGPYRKSMGVATHPLVRYVKNQTNKNKQKENNLVREGLSLLNLLQERDGLELKKTTHFLTHPITHILTICHLMMTFWPFLFLFSLSLVNRDLTLSPKHPRIDEKGKLTREIKTFYEKRTMFLTMSLKSLIKRHLLNLKNIMCARRGHLGAEFRSRVCC